MRRSTEQLRKDAQSIWRAGVEAVRPARLIPRHVVVEGDALWIGDRDLDLKSIDRIAIVGAGKASGAMAVAIENALGDAVLKSKRVFGWVNVPADCIEPTHAVRLFAARPGGINEPTEAGLEGTRQILRLVGELGPRDLCLCVVSGGGSALLTAPSQGISLETKIAITREIVASGGDIRQLNTVRRALSDVKGGGLARACRAGWLVSLILSDVPGDDLCLIASGPTFAQESNPDAALAILAELDLLQTPAARAVAALLPQKQGRSPVTDDRANVVNILIGNNATAVDAAGIEAERRGYSHAMISATAPEASAEVVGQWLAETADSMRRSIGPDCLISGGETVVDLIAEAERGKGGRNQQVALAALATLSDWANLALLSGGTDGEDGPTDAAGALVDSSIVAAAERLGLNPQEFLMRNDAYTFFEQCGGLFKTGPTRTNVCDLRVICVSREE